MLPIPADLVQPMYLYREWGSPLPQQYIDWHKGLAEEAKKALVKDFEILAERMVNDGWMDSMMVTELVVEHRRSHQLLKLVWNDGSQCWFFRYEKGGSSPLSLWSPGNHR